jgi:hypothetical protein
MRAAFAGGSAPLGPAGAAAGGAAGGAAGPVAAPDARYFESQAESLTASLEELLRLYERAATSQAAATRAGSAGPGWAGGAPPAAGGAEGAAASGGAPPDARYGEGGGAAVGGAVAPLVDLFSAFLGYLQAGHGGARGAAWAAGAAAGAREGDEAGATDPIGGAEDGGAPDAAELARLFSHFACSWPGPGGTATAVGGLAAQRISPLLLPGAPAEEAHAASASGLGPGAHAGGRASSLGPGGLAGAASGALASPQSSVLLCVNVSSAAPGQPFDPAGPGSALATVDSLVRQLEMRHGGALESNPEAAAVWADLLALLGVDPAARAAARARGGAEAEGGGEGADVRGDVGGTAGSFYGGVRAAATSAGADAGRGPGGGQSAPGKADWLGAAGAAAAAPYGGAGAVGTAGSEGGVGAAEPRAAGEGQHRSDAGGEEDAPKCEGARGGEEHAAAGLRDSGAAGGHGDGAQAVAADASGSPAVVAADPDQRASSGEPLAPSSEAPSGEQPGDASREDGAPPGLEVGGVRFHVTLSEITPVEDSLAATPGKAGTETGGVALRLSVAEPPPPALQLRLGVVGDDGAAAAAAAEAELAQLRQVGLLATSSHRRPQDRPVSSQPSGLVPTLAPVGRPRRSAAA